MEYVKRFILIHSVFCFLGFALGQTPPRMVLPIGHSNWICQSNLSLDKKYLITGSFDGTVKLWDVKSRKELYTLQDLRTPDPIYITEISPDCKHILTVSNSKYKNSIKIYDIVSKKCISNFNLGPDLLVSNASFSTDCKHLIIIAKDPLGFKKVNAILWNFEKNKVAFEINTDKNKITDIHWNKHRNYLVSLNEDGFFTLLHLDSLDIVRSFKNIKGEVKDFKLISGLNLLYKSKDSGEFYVGNFLTGKVVPMNDFNSANYADYIISNSGRLGVFSDNKNKAFLYDFEQNKVVRKINLEDNKVDNLKFCGNDSFYLISSLLELKVWDCNYDKLLYSKRYAFGKGSIFNATFNNNHDCIIYSYYDYENGYVTEIKELKKEFSIAAFKGKVSEINSMEVLQESNQVFIGVSEDIRLWNMINGKNEICLEKISNKINSLKVFDKIKKVLVNTSDSLFLFEINTRKRIASVAQNSKLNAFNLSPDGDKILYVNNGLVHLLTLKDRKSRILDLNKTSIRKLMFSPDGNWILATDDIKKNIILWDAHSYKRIHTMNHGRGIKNFVHITPDNEHIITGGNEGKMAVWLLRLGVKKYEDIRLSDKSGFVITNVSISPDSKYAFFTGANYFYQDSIDGNLLVLDIETGRIVKKWEGSRYIIQSIAFSSNAEDIVTGSYDGVITQYNFNNLSQKSQIFIKDNTVKSAKYVLQDNFLIISLGNNKFILMDKNSGRLIYEWFIFDKSNWLIKLPYSPYYMCSKDAGKMLHYVTSDLKVIGFEQLDPVYNRPDVVLDSIGMFLGDADTDLIAQYRRLWEKRINHLGLDKNKLGKGELAVPTAEIANAELLPYETSEDRVTLKITAIDYAYALRRFNVYVNEVPYFGSFGIPLNLSKSRSWDTAFSIPLSLGEIKIQVAVLNELGLENYKYPKYINLIKSPEQELVETTHFIGIGVDSFIDQSQNLRYCSRDIHDLESELKSKQYRSKLFINEDVTKENILRIKQYLLDSTSVHDKVIISCSSHGLRDLSDNENLYLATYNTDFEHPKDQGLKYEDLLDLLDGIPARKKLLLIDACNSGDLEDVEAIDSNGHKLQKVNSTALVVNNSNARGESFDLGVNQSANTIKLSEVFINVQNHNGTVVIGAAGGRQAAQDGVSGTINGKEIKNGAFTYSVLEYLSQPGEKRVNGLKNYVEKRVPEITNGQQQPTTKQETLETNWLIK